MGRLYQTILFIHEGQLRQLHHALRRPVHTSVSKPSGLVRILKDLAH